MLFGKPNYHVIRSIRRPVLNRPVIRNGVGPPAGAAVLPEGLAFVT
jgi:hypothetical protein